MLAIHIGGYAMPGIFVFSSSNVTNIWAGIGARKWAVSEKQAENASISTKGKKMPVGALGLIYCVEKKALTTPFVVTSGVTEQEIADVWPQSWRLPFSIAPLGTPQKLLATTDLSALVPSLKDTGANWNTLFFVTPTMVFTSSKLTDADWAEVSGKLLD